MESVAKYVSGAILLLGVILGWVLVRTTALVLGSFGPAADPILFAGIQASGVIGAGLAIGLVVYAMQNERWYRGATEVAVELAKVTWPDKPDTLRSTRVVIVFSVIVSLFLAFFDLIWKAITDTILSGGA